MMDSVMLSWLAAAIIGASIALYYYSRNAYSFWEKRRLKGPKPWPFVGNFLQLMGKDRHDHQKEWSKKYGKVYGIYRGVKPDLVIADAEVLQQICIRDFDAFMNHEENEFFNHYQKSFLFFLQDDKWKRIRALMSPTFTSGKIKRMFQLLDACADDLIDCYQEQFLPGTEKTLISPKDVYNLFTIDAIATCCYGLKLERSNARDLESAARRNSFVRMAMKLFEFSLVRFFIAMSVPEFLLKLVNFKLMNDRPFDEFSKVMKQLVDKRRTSGKKLDDYLQLLVDAKLEDKIELNDMDSQENHHAGLTSESMLSDQKRMIGELNATTGSERCKLTEHEIVTNAMFLLVVGLETTSTMLTNCAYFLSFHPEIQEKLFEEVGKIVEYKSDDKRKTYFSYEALTSCQYLDSVVSETLRYFTPATLTVRIAKRDYHIEKYNLDIPKGCMVSAAFYAIMNDPDYWPEPDKFNPERFMPGNKEKIVPGSYCPFGIGPRHCLGMRFSLTEAKLALAKTIMKYRLEPRPKAKFPPELSGKFGFAHIQNSEVYIVPRTANASH